MEILLNSKFYSKESINRAISAFESEGVAAFRYENKKGDHKIVLSEIEESFKDSIKEEFCNFVLSEEMRRD